ncbi:hypothetical protein D3Z52_12800 [Clostridiaceae bacterium]|nr:hypothetical protein [Clostridiaceae bacterium]
MGLSKLAAKCRVCPFVDTCDHKRMEALGYLPLPEPTAQPTELGYRSVENFWDDPKILIGSESDSGGLVMAGGEIDIDVEGLVRTISRELQLPERVLGGALTSDKSEKQ